MPKFYEEETPIKSNPDESTNGDSQTTQDVPSNPQLTSVDTKAEEKSEKDPYFFEEHLLESPLDTPELTANNGGLSTEEQDAKQQISLPVDSNPNEKHSKKPDDFDSNFYQEFVKTLLTWKAPSRPFRKKDRSYYTTIGILVVLISLILFLAGERMMIGVILALVFLVYVLNFVQPEEIEYKLSTQGVTIGDHFYHWDELDSFWFSHKDGFKTLNILTNLRFPGMLILVIGDTPEEDIKRVCARFLPFHEIAPKDFINHWSEKMQKYFPLEKPKS